MLEEFDVSAVKKCGSAIVHGVVATLSPVKKSKKNYAVKSFGV